LQWEQSCISSLHRGSEHREREGDVERSRMRGASERLRLRLWENMHNICRGNSSLRVTGKERGCMTEKTNQEAGGIMKAGKPRMTKANAIQMQQLSAQASSHPHKQPIKRGQKGTRRRDLQGIDQACSHTQDPKQEHRRSQGPRFIPLKHANFRDRPSFRMPSLPYCVRQPQSHLYLCKGP
jgi:hypothetical protein